MSEDLDKIARLSLDTLRRMNEEAALAADTYADANKAMLLSFIIEKFQADQVLQRALVILLARVEQLEVLGAEDRRALELVRQLTAENAKRLNVMAAAMSAGLDELARVADRTVEHGQTLAKQAEAMKRQAESLAGLTEP